MPLLLGVAMALSACGGDPAAHDDGSTGGGDPDVQPPASVAYQAPMPLYVAGEAIDNNRAQVAGGPPSEFTVKPALPEGLRLDPKTGEITGTPATFQPQATYTVTASNAGGSAATDLRLTITSRGSWTTVANIPTARHYSALVKLRDGRALAIGGSTGGTVTSDARVYNPATGTWAAAAPSLHPRNGHTATVLADGRVLVVGGADGTRTAHTAVELYDPVHNTWTATGSLAEPRENHTATLLADGKVLVIGGFNMNPTTTFRDTAELYDPATGTWTLLATRLSAARGQHAAELLPDGQTVLVAAGVNRPGFVTDAELVRADGTGPNVTMPGKGGIGNVSQAARLPNGDVLVTNDGTTTWRFHAATATWSTNSLPAARTQPTMLRLPDGRVLLAGGTGAGGVRLRTAELYNPDVDVWTTASSMATGRNAAVASVLEDGGVLVVGGFTGSNSSDAAEIFRP